MREKQIFDLVLLLGEVMLSSGGEIFRTNELMNGAADQFGLRQFSVFTIANGIFVSAVVEGEICSCQVRHIPLRSVDLSRVEAMNHLSRCISDGLLTPEETLQEVRKIQNTPEPSVVSQTLASGAGAGFFCILFGGSFRDAAVSFLAGILLNLFLVYFCSRFNVRKVMSNILSAALVTFFCCVMYLLGAGPSLDHMVIGSIFPLVPGVPFTISIRNFMENDYIAGLVRLIDALLVAGCIAVGVGSIIILWNFLLGGMIL